MMNNQELSSDTVPVASTLPTWRTEPEIDSERQQFLRQRLLIVPDIQRSIYPFKDIQLTRANVEWLLATHEQASSPNDWSDPAWPRRTSNRGSSTDGTAADLAPGAVGLSLRYWLEDGDGIGAGTSHLVALPYMNKGEKVGDPTS